MVEKSATMAGIKEGGLRWRKDQTEWKQAKHGERMQASAIDSTAARNLSAGNMICS